MGFKRNFDNEFKCRDYHSKMKGGGIKLDRSILLITDAICKMNCEEFIKNK